MDDLDQSLKDIAMESIDRGVKLAAQTPPEVLHSFFVDGADSSATMAGTLARLMLVEATLFEAAYEMIEETPKNFMETMLLTKRGVLISLVSNGIIKIETAKILYKDLVDGRTQAVLEQLELVLAKTQGPIDALEMLGDIREVMKRKR